MLILNKRKVEKLAEKCGHDAQKHLRLWIEDVEDQKWRFSQDIRNRYNDASIIDNKRVVFNICHNVYRLVVDVSYEEQEINMVWFAKHDKYDRTDIKRL